MKLRSAAWAGTLFLIILANSCTRSTPGNTPSSQAQPTAELTPQTSPAPAAAEEAKAPPEPTPAVKKRAAKRAPEVARNEVPPTPAAAPTPPPPVVLPAGTTLAVRLNDSLDTKTSKAGDTFTASVAQPVTVHGRTVIPAGAAVSGDVENAKQGGKISGESELSVHLTTLRLNGTSYPIATGPLVQQAKGKGSRTAKIGAGTAAAGALIGGIAGGGKGAAIGALAGGGAGVAGSAFTGNKGVTIPAETVVQFQLAQPLQLPVLGTHQTPSTPPELKPSSPPPNQEEQE
jgi:hypothetical protein